MPASKVHSLFVLLLLTSRIALASAPIEVVPPEFRGVVQPQVAVSANGNVYVTFGKGTSIYCSASGSGELAFQNPIEIASLPKLALGMRRGPRIAACEKAVVISAISHAEGNLFAWTSEDRGKTWSEAVKINQVETSAREGMHAMASDGKRNVHLCWLDLRNKQTELWAATSADQGKSWRTNVLIYRSPDGHICECCSPALAAGDSTGVWAMWRNWLGGSRDTYLAASLDAGKTFGPAKKLGAGTWPLKGCPMDGGNLALTPAGKPLTVWRREMSVYVAGETGPEKLLSSQGMQPVVAYGRGSVYYLWQKGPQVMLQKGTNSATVLAEAAAFPAMASASPDGPLIAVWEAVTDGMKTVMAQRLD